MCFHICIAERDNFPNSRYVLSFYIIVIFITNSSVGISCCKNSSSFVWSIIGDYDHFLKMKRTIYMILVSLKWFLSAFVLFRNITFFFFLNIILILIIFERWRGRLCFIFWNSWIFPMSFTGIISTTVSSSVNYITFVFNVISLC